MFAFRDARAIEQTVGVGKGVPRVPLFPPGGTEGRCRGEVCTSGGGVCGGRRDGGILKISRKVRPIESRKGKNDLVWPMSDGK